MNVDSLKSELQQVLDNDVVLRKEFNELKRSLSDYRNQLIMRDEDCKRLQVTIDVLNTKLVVMERDNTNYKGELTSFKELRGTIKEQLDSKQEEIEARLFEIQELKNDLNAIATDYELKIENIKSEAAAELERVKSEYSSEINELKTTTHYKEAGIKDEFENRLSEITISYADKEQSLTFNHEEEITALKSNYESELSSLKTSYESRISDLSSSGNEELNTLKSGYSSTIALMEDDFNARLQQLESSYKAEISGLGHELQEQKHLLTSGFNDSIDALKNEFALKESILISGYEQQIEELKSIASSSSQEMSVSFQNQIEELKSSHETIVNEKDASYLQKIENLAVKYEDRLSNTLIHSTSQNSKLTEELGRAQLENDHFKEKIRELVIHIDSQNSDIESLSLQLKNFQLQLRNEGERFSQLSADFETFKQNSSLSNSEHVNELNNQINNLNSANAEIVNGLNSRIEQLDEELKNVGSVFESTTNVLAETEISLELKVQELGNASQQIEALNTQIASFESAFSEKDKAFEVIKSDLEASFQQSLEAKDIEYQKLLVENSSIINEIDLAQDKVEAQEAEIVFLKSELEEMKVQGIGKAEHFKDTLVARNFEITNLEANNAALAEELSQAKAELTALREQALGLSQSGESLDLLQQSFNTLMSEKESLLSEVNSMQAVILKLNGSVSDLQEKIAAYETEISALKANSNAEEQDAFIDRLFKQIDLLNDQHLSLLDEKEQMANQLLKMNDVVGALSQQVDSERIDVTDLNNHRKSVILAKNSGGSNEKVHMKEQINDLVREIDKCIALLSA